jgi:hypothetical protein
MMSHHQDCPTRKGGDDQTQKISQIPQLPGFLKEPGVDDNKNGKRRVRSGASMLASASVCDPPHYADHYRN